MSADCIRFVSYLDRREKVTEFYAIISSDANFPAAASLPGLPVILTRVNVRLPYSIVKINIKAKG
jgi:hypothetical protein